MSESTSSFEPVEPGNEEPSPDVREPLRPWIEPARNAVLWGIAIAVTVALALSLTWALGLQSTRVPEPTGDSERFLETFFYRGVIVTISTGLTTSLVGGWSLLREGVPRKRLAVMSAILVVGVTTIGFVLTAGITAGVVLPVLGLIELLGPGVGSGPLEISTPLTTSILGLIHLLVGHRLVDADLSSFLPGAAVAGIVSLMTSEPMPSSEFIVPFAWGAATVGLCLGWLYLVGRWPRFEDEPTWRTLARYAGGFHALTGGLIWVGLSLAPLAHTLL
jgi:hypothetical protein